MYEKPLASAGEWLSRPCKDSLILAIALNWQSFSLLSWIFCDLAKGLLKRRQLERRAEVPADELAVFKL